MPPQPNPLILYPDETEFDEPIVFTARGLDLDVCINVLGQEFHVHSNILKPKSEFFCTGIKWMDSPDRAQNIRGPFRYNWVSTIDDDGTWGLIAATPENEVRLQIDPGRCAGK